MRRYLAVIVLLLLTLACQALFPPAATPTPSDLSPVCELPSCAADEVYFCPDDCPDNCGIVCATPTPPADAESATPEPLCTPPLCEDDEIIICPEDDCPGGCGSVCATATPPLDEEPSDEDATAIPPSDEDVTATPTTADSSADGAVLAVVIDGNLWALTANGDLYQITDSGLDGSPVLSPDGRQVLFSRELPVGPAGLGRFELRVIETIAGATDRLLVAPEDLPAETGPSPEGEGTMRFDRLSYDVAWLPDGDSVAFNTLFVIEHGLATNHDLWIVDIETGELSRLLEDGEGGAFAFSPDGEALVVADPGRVSMLNADGTGRRTLVTFEAVNTASEYAYVPQPVWWPDGNFALVAISGPEPWDFDIQPTATLWRLPRSSAEQGVSADAERLNELEGWLLQTSMSDSLWSPDRQHMAYLTGEEHVFTTLQIANWDGSDPVAYATDVTAVHGWSPDGAYIVYAVGGEQAQDDTPYRLFLGAPGAEPVDITPTHTTSEAFSLAWIDTDTFVYITGESGDVVLNIGNLDGVHRPLATGVSAFDTRH